jgi:hypothetical protein
MFARMGVKEYGLTGESEKTWTRATKVFALLLKKL